jgi:DNA-binding Xre family transcriptional regulator
VLGRSQQGYDHIEKRRAKLTIEDLLKLCDYYKVKPEEILDNKQNSKDR